MLQEFTFIISFFTLFLLEVVLGIDNLVLLAVLTEPLPVKQRMQARLWGLTFAWITRLILLATTLWIAQLEKPVFKYAYLALSYRDLFFIVGGIFLLIKATQEIHQTILPQQPARYHFKNAFHYFWLIVIQIGIMDIIFSLDSVLTAVGLTQHFSVMAAAITGAILVMLFASHWVAQLIKRFPTLKILALSFLLMIGVVLIADGFKIYIPRSYIYFSMCFSMGVETLNLIYRSKRYPRRH